MDSHKRLLNRVLVGILILNVISFFPTVAQAQQLEPNKPKLAIVHFFGIGPAFGDLQGSQSNREYPELGTYSRTWHFHPGYTYTARFLLWRSHFARTDNHRLVTIGLLSGGDFSLLPMKGSRIESVDGIIQDPPNNKLIVSNVFLTPGVVVRLGKIPLQLLLMAGMNYRFSNESSLSGIQLENGFGTSLVAMIRFHSIWSGISIHKSRSKYIYHSNMRPPGYETSVDMSCTIVRLSIGFNGWHP